MGSKVQGSELDDPLSLITKTRKSENAKKGKTNDLSPVRYAL